jgi:Fic family protein
MTYAFAPALMSPASFVGIALSAKHHTVEQVEFLIEKTRLLERLRVRTKPRQEDALRMSAEGPDAPKGYRRVANYRTVNDFPSVTATRDLSYLVQIGALRKQGELKYARYFLCLPTNGSNVVEQGVSRAT